MNYPGPQFDDAMETPEPALNTLNAAETFALWALRLWVRAYRHGGAMLPLLREGFAVAGAPDAWLVLDEFMTRLLGCVKRPLDLRNPRAAQLSADEQNLLRWLADWQRKEAPPPCASLRAVAAPGARLARSLLKAGLVFEDAPLGSEIRAADRPRRMH